MEVEMHGINRTQMETGLAGESTWLDFIHLKNNKKQGKLRQTLR
jgi:hypothetical protein